MLRMFNLFWGKTRLLWPVLAACAIAAAAISAAAAHGGGKDGAAYGSAQRAEKCQTLAELVGSDCETMRTELRGGSSLAQIAESNGVDPQTVIDALAVQANERLDAAVAAGKLSADEAEEKRAALESWVSTRVNEPRSERGAGRWHKRGGDCRKSGNGEAEQSDADTDAAGL